MKALALGGKVALALLLIFFSVKIYSQCNVTPQSGPIIPLSRCSLYDSVGVFAGSYFDLTTTANTYYDFKYADKGCGNSTGMCVTANNGSGFTSNQTNVAFFNSWFTGTCTSTRLSSFRTGTTNTCSALLLYKYSTPTTPTFSTAPTAVCNNVNTTYTINAASAATAYTWSVSGTAAPTIVSGQGTTAAVINFTKPGTATVSVFATNNGFCNSSQISTATITVAGVTISASQAVCSGSSTTQTATTIGGTGTPSYQWQSSPNQTTWTNVGTNSATLSTGAITAVTYFRCIYTNTGLGCTSVTSNVDTISLISQPTITTQPSNRTICAGNTDSLHVAATGSASLTYQWQYLNGSTFVNVSNGLPTGVSYAGATGTGLSITASSSTPAGNYQYRCVVSAGGCSPSNSNTAVVTINAAPSIVSQTAVDTICDGTSGNISVTAGGTGPFTYQWQYFNGVSFTNVANGTPAGVTYTNGTSATLTIATTNGTTPQGNYRYHCIVSSSGCSSATSSGSTVTVGPPTPSAPVATAASNISCTSFTANWNTTTNATSYFVDVAYDAGFTAFLPGWDETNVGNVTSVNITGLTAWLPYYYRVRAADNCIGAASNVITVYTLPAAPKTPSDNSYYNFEYTSIPSANREMAFAIYGNGNPSFLQDFTIVSGTPSLYPSGGITGVNAFDGSQYVLSGVCNISGNWSEGVQVNRNFKAGTNYNVTVAIRNMPGTGTTPTPVDVQFVLLQSPLASTSIPGDGCSPTPSVPSNALVAYTVSNFALNSWQVVSFPVTGLTANYTQLWIRETFSSGAPLVTTDFAFDSLVINQANNSSFVATQVGCNSFQANWTSSVNATSYSVDVSTSSTFATFVSGWNNQNVGNVTNVIVSGLSEGTTYYYRVRANDACGSSASTPAVSVTLTTSPHISSEPASTTNVCRGDTTGLSVSATGGPGLTYLWQYNNAGNWITITDNTPSGITYDHDTSATVSINTALSATPGTYQYRCIVSGAVGCAADTSTVASVNVNSVPVITSCPGSVTLNTDPSLCDATVIYPNAVVTGSPAPTVTYSQNSGTIFALGTTTVTVTASNICGTATCSFTVTVVDQTPPTIVCPGTQTVNLDASCSATLPDYTSLATTSDNCSSSGPGPNSIVVTQDPAAGYSLAGVGNTVVTLTATDSSGNSNSCTFNVSVVDNTPPTALCKAATTYLDDAGNASITASQVDNGSYDNCGIASITVAPASFTCNNVGDNTVTLTVTDINGNVSTCTATVTVVDSTAPVAICQNITVQLDGNGSASIVPAQINNGSYDNCGVSTLGVYPYTFDCSNVGSNSVQLTVTDVNGNSSSCNAMVTVQDNIAPTVICKDLTVDLDAYGAASITGADADGGSYDNCGIASRTVSPNTFNCSNVGPNTITLTVTDVNGNVSTCTATAQVRDVTPPSAVCQDVTVQLDASGNASVTASQVNNGSSDNCSIASLSVSPNTFTCSNVGANSVTLTVTDVNDNVSTCSSTVTVQDNVAPVAICHDVTVQLDAAGNASVTAAQVDNGSYDNCAIASITVSPNTFTCANVGSNSVTLTVTDVNGNMSTCGSTVTVQDNIAPTAVCKNVTVQLDASGNVSIGATDVNNGSFDNCSIATLSVSPNTFNCSNVGNNSVTLTVTDVNGNTSTCTSVVTVQDNVAPLAICQPVTVQLDASGNATVTASQVNNGSHDNCSIASISVSPSAFTCSNVGANTVTLTVTDVNGNSSTCTTTVTVQDNVAPTASCKAATVYLNSSGNGSLTASQVDNGSTDACGIASRSVSPSSFTCSNLGANTATLTVTDVNGNSSTCTSTVTVADTIKPTAVCKNITVTLGSGGTVSITASQVDNGSSDNCGIASRTVSPSAFTCANIGANTVTLTVTDASGNVSTCSSTVTVSGSLPSCSLSYTASNNDIIGGLFVGNVTGIIFLGYGPQSFNLNSTVSGGSSFTYSWSGSNLSCYNCANPVFSPTSAGNYTFTLTVTNNYGCTTSCTISICVVDARSGIHGKILICHHPPGNPSNTDTISVAGTSVLVHLLNGDQLGGCGSFCGDGKMDDDIEQSLVAAPASTNFNVKVYPNPFTSKFHLKVEGPGTENIHVRIYDVAGKLIEEKPDVLVGTDVELGDHLADGVYVVDVKQGQFSKQIRLVKSE